ncbi:hypothetical protein R3P38DRAFT_2867362 [Favolaschia claudopus]|uniref:Uncharacterized protein n=1 Tax=Favolaschia claudopus TaxID=2862362 RepID=A0AAW0D649_9AGAR
MALFTVQSSVFNAFWDICSAELFEVISEMLFYGILLVLVCFAGTILVRKQAAGGRVLLLATIMMFVFATTQLIFRVLAARKAYAVFYLAVAGEFAPESPLAREAASLNLAYNFVEDILLVTNNLFTDGILIYRCWLIWGQNLYVIIAPTIMLLLSTVLSYISAVEGDYPSANGPAIDLRIGFLLSLLTNMVLVGLTAGRIFHTRRLSIRRLDADVVRRYNTAMAMILESGAILTAWVIIYVILRSLDVPPTVWRVFRGGLAMLLNIVPTMIVVRVGLGHSINDSERTKVGTVTGSATSSSISGTRTRGGTFTQGNEKEFFGSASV